MSQKHYDALFLPMGENDACENTVADYLGNLLHTLIVEQDGFSGKRPFGNSGWIHELAYPLVKNKCIKGTIFEDEDDTYAEGYSTKELTKFAEGMVKELFETLRNYRDLQH